MKAVSKENGLSGGNYKDKSGIKDCSDCLIPHSPKGYDYINQKIMGANQKRRE